MRAASFSEVFSSAVPRVRRAALVVASALGVSACDPTPFPGFRDDAPVFVVRGVSAGAGAFGGSLSTVDATVRGLRVSRLAVSGGPGTGEGSGFRVLFGFDGEPQAASMRLGDGIAFAGCDSGDCSAGSGVSIAAFPGWSIPGGATFHGCVAVPASVTGQVQIRCEDQLPNFQSVAGLPGEGLGTSSVGIGTRDETTGAPAEHPAGVALFGAPEASGGGAVYRLASGSAALERLDLGAASLPPEARLGAGLAVAVLDPSSVMFAAWAQGSPERVLVGTLVAGAAGVSPVLRACLEGMSGWGSALALGDLDGDGVPDLAVGRAGGAAPGVGGDDAVDVFDGTALLGGATPACGAAGQPVSTVRIACADVADPAACAEGIAFGAALAVGDLDDDGVGDLAIGAPRATSRGVAGAGAVHALQGQAGRLAALGSVHAESVSSTPRAGAGLGTTVAMLRGRSVGGGRAELVAGAPNVAEVSVFFCSGLPGDRPADVSGGERGCIPVSD